jgi:hypothetical protein
MNSNLIAIDVYSEISTDRTASSGTVGVTLESNTQAVDTSSGVARETDQGPEPTGLPRIPNIKSLFVEDFSELEIASVRYAVPAIHHFNAVEACVAKICEPIEQVNMPSPIKISQNDERTGDKFAEGKTG